MTKDEATELVAQVNALWGKEPHLQAFKDQCRVWWRFVHDLTLEDCMRVIDRMALMPGFVPKPGEVRTRVIVGVVPDALEAWEELQAASAAVASGNEPDDMHDLTVLVARKLGEQVTGLRTNGDRDNFVAFYNKTVNEWIADQCLTTPPPKPS